MPINWRYVAPSAALINQRARTRRCREEEEDDDEEIRRGGLSSAARPSRLRNFLVAGIVVLLKEPLGMLAEKQ